MTEQHRKLILTYAKCDMNRSEAGRKLYMHVNTVDYHLKKIKKETGLDPKKFYDLIKLLEMEAEEDG